MFGVEEKPVLNRNGLVLPISEKYRVLFFQIAILLNFP